MAKTTRQATKLTLSRELVEEVKAHDVNLSSAAEEGLREAVAIAKAEKWKAENAQAIESSNAFVDKRGFTRYDG